MTRFTKFEGLCLLLLVIYPSVLCVQYGFDNKENSIHDGIYLYSHIAGKFNQPGYLAIASKVVRPGQVYRVAVSLLATPQPLLVRASLHRDGEQITSASEEMKTGQMSTLLMQVPYNAIPGNYRLRIEGNVNGVLGGTGFVNESFIEFSERFLTILIQTNQLVYNVEQTIRIRVILLTTELKPFTEPVDVYLVDSRGFIMKRWVSTYPYLGYVSLKFELPYDYPTGWWTVRVAALGQSEEKKIMLERWFGHRYDVSVSLPSFVLNTEDRLEGQIMANYTNVALVSGNATVRVYVRPMKQYYNRVLGRRDTYIEEVIDTFYGVYDFSFSMTQLRRLSEPIPLEHCEIEVQADVGERFMDAIMTGYSRVRVTNSSISLRFLGISPQVFKPGMPFLAHISVSYHDLVPLPEDKLASSFVTINCIATRRDGSRSNFLTLEERFTNEGVVEIQMDTPSDAERISLQAIYEDREDRARTDLTLLSLYSETRRYMQISTTTKTAKAGEYAIFHVWANFYLKSFSYLVVSKGIIILVGNEEVAGMINSITTFSVPISPEMAPVCHVITYHVTPDGEVLADSIILPVRAVNRKKFTLDVNMKQDRSANLIELVPGLTTESIAGMTAVDTTFLSTHGRNDITPTSAVEAMYGFEKRHHRLQRVIWRDREGAPEKISYFVTSNYGRETNQTFTLTDLLVFTNMNITAMPDLCNNTLGYSQCASGQCYLTTKKCDGYRDCDDGTDEGDCYKPQEDEDLLNFYLYRFNRQHAFFDGTGGDFAWQDKILGDDTVEYVACDAPKGPTLWQFNALAMSKVYGLAILEEPVLFDSSKPFFVVVEAPETAAIGEQIGLRVALFNYQFFEIKAEVILEASDDYRFVQVESFGIVNSYNPRTTSGEHQHLVYIKPVNQMLVHIPIVATKIGQIEVTIIGRTQVAMDRITTTINIVPDAVPVYIHTSLLLDMRSEAYVVKYLDVNVTEDPIIPFEETYRRYIFGSPKASVTVIGDVVGAPFPSDPLHPLGMDALRMSPAVKSGDHIMFNFAYNLYTLTYLRLTNQLKPAVTKGLLEYLSQAYVHESVFYKDGAYTMFKREPSVWLTAYCARVFHEAQYPDWENYLYIDPKMLANNIKFLLKHQTNEGSFYEKTIHPWNRNMDPRSKRLHDFVAYRNVTLTAHVLITLNVVADLQGQIRVQAANAKTRAVRYLERQLSQLDNPYDVAIVTYALLEAGSVEAEMGFNMLDQMKHETEGLVYWSPTEIKPPELVYQNQRPFIKPRLPQRHDSLAVEATAYSLLIYLRYGGIIQDQIVKWLNTMRMHDSVFITSQDTIVAMKALIEYSFRTHVRDVTSMKLTVESSSNAGKQKVVNISPNNLAEPMVVDIKPNVWGHAEVLAQGAGMAVLQMEVQYNVDREFLFVQPPVEAFELTVKGHYHGRNKSNLNIESCARWILNESEASGLAVMEISLPTGYFNYKPTLDNYVRRDNVPRLRRGRVFPGSAVFMFDYLNSDWSCVKFDVQRWFPVANATRFMKARIYDYYARELFKEIIYENFDLFVLNICEVCGSYQCPYCPYFSIAAKPVLQWMILLGTALLLLLNRIIQ